MKRKFAVLLLGLALGAGCHGVNSPARSRDLASRNHPAQKAAPVQPLQTPAIPVSRGAVATAQQSRDVLPPAPAAMPPYEPVPAAPRPPVPPATDLAASAVPALTTLVSVDPPAPAPPPPAPGPAVSDLRRLHQAAAERSAGMDSYIARLRRREVVHGKQKPEEVALFKFRRDPWSVYFKWIGAEAKGREAIYVKGRYDDKVHTLLAAGDMLLMPAGAVFALDPHSPMVLRHSRHPITEAGLGSLVGRFGRLVESGSGQLRYLGPQQRAEYAGSLEAVEQTIPPRGESHLPGGGRRWWFFDPSSGLPVLVITHDEAGREVEYYCYDRIQFPVKLDDDDFNPSKLWPRRN